MLKNKVILLVVILFTLSSKAGEQHSADWEKINLEPTNLENEYLFLNLNNEFKTQQLKQIYETCKTKKGVKVKYTKFLESRTHGKLGKVGKLKVNGTDVFLESYIAFELIKNCKKLVPVDFVSAKDQEWLGHKIKEGQYISMTYPNRHHPAVFGDNGYAENKGPQLSKESEWMKEPNYTFSQYCIPVYKNKETSRDTYVGAFFRGKFYPKGLEERNMWEGRSKYIGHVLCSDNPKAKISCDTGDAMSNIADYVWQEDEEDSAEAIKQRIELGKKCDEAIAKHEKETGKKVEISPFLPWHIEDKFSKQK